MSHALDAVDGAAVRRWADACVRSLDAHREDIDRINVFPVADRDTGTNMLRTMRAAVDAVARELVAATGAGQDTSAARDVDVAGNGGVIAAGDGALNGALEGAADGAGTAVAGAVGDRVLNGAGDGAGDAAGRVVGDGARDGAADGAVNGAGDAGDAADDVTRDVAAGGAVDGAGDGGLDAAAVWAALASGALAGARGNSGVILSQVLRGLGEVLGADPADVAGALGRADELAAKAVSDPAPGTMLTVLHTAALAARTLPGPPAEIAAVAARAAAEALAGTLGQLAALAKAGVVDAGGQGLVLVLDELAAVLSGGDHQAADPRLEPGPRTPREPDLLRTVREAGSAEFAYEVMYSLADVPEAAADRLRAVLRRLGDCVSVVGDGAGRWAVHVHCNDVGAAVEAGVEAGRPHRITVIRFDDQVAEASSRFARDRAVVALVRGDGVAELFRAENAVVYRLGADQPSVGELVAVLAGTQAEHVTVLPNEPELAAALDVAAAEAVRAGQDVLIVPTASPVQGLAALAVHDPGRRPGEDVVAMAEAAAATRRGELTLATGEGITWVGRCQPDDVLGLLDGEVVLIEPGPASDAAVLAGARRLVDRMLAGGGELVTVLSGARAPAGIADELAEHVRAEHREVEFVGYAGGQAEPILLVGVE